MKIWIDIMNTSHVHVFNSLVKRLEKNHEILITTRDYAENRKLLEYYGREYVLYGAHGGSSFVNKSLNALKMIFTLLRMDPQFDVNISMASHTSPIISKLKSKRSIALTDNEYFIQQNPMLMNFFSDLILPSVLKGKVNGKTSKTNIHFFPGFKEEIYIADYKPDLEFLSKIPFQEFITIRPEAFQAIYVNSTNISLVPKLLKRFSENGTNVLYLPRYDIDRKYASGFDHVYVPPGPLNGLDVCYYSKAVLTGSGTFTREAACMGTPAISFYPGTRLLAVDQSMVDDELIFHSRNVDDIISYTMQSERRKVRIAHCREVQQCVFKLIESIIQKRD